MRASTYALLSLAVVCCGAVAFGGIAGTAHDFSAAGWNSSGEICLPCHVPHNAQTGAGGESMVLWNHALTTQTFEMYTTLAGHTSGQPEGSSKMCLSCHDGVTAIDNYGGNEGYFNNVRIPGWRSTVMGTDLRDDHPIGIQYPPPDNLPGYKDKSTFSGVRVVPVDGVDRVECTSCHDPHNNVRGNFLRQTMDSSTLCMECHDK